MRTNFTYYMPTKIVYEIDGIKKIDSLINKRKTLLITSEGFVTRGLIKYIKSLTSSIIDVMSNVKSHPEFNDLEFIYNKTRELDYELIVAIGGGSVLDTAKFISVKNELREFSFVKKLCKNLIEKKDYKVTPLIAIPTTSGTGSELTSWATIWDKDEKKKNSLYLPELYPEVALYDPTLTLSMPKDITLQTGLDTLSHALESIWNKNANEITIKYAVKSARLIMDNLLPLSQNLNSLEYRNNIMKACMYAGLAFSNTQTAIAHAMSYYITIEKGIPHGIACSFTLPILIDSIIGKYNFIDKALEEIFDEISSKKIRELFNSLNISVELKEYKINKDDLNKLTFSLNNNQRLDNSLISYNTINFNLD